MLTVLDADPELADAYFADNDIIAAAAMKAFRERGFRLPEDISIIGFDDMPLCDMMVPSLSTMRVRKQELGAAAIARLMDRIADNKKEYLKISMSIPVNQKEKASPFLRETLHLT